MTELINADGISEIIIMARPPSAWKQGDVTRATRAVEAAGQRISGVRIDKNGVITVLTGVPNPDDDLDRELAAFQNGQS